MNRINNQMWNTTHFWWVRVHLQIDTPKGAGPQEAILFPTSRNLWVGIHHKTKTNGWKAKQKVFSSWFFYTIPSRSILQLPGHSACFLNFFDVSRVGVFHYPSCTIASTGVAPCEVFYTTWAPSDWSILRYPKDKDLFEKEIFWRSTLVTSQDQ